MNGHYWCDHCDENAYGKSCQRCHRLARFVPDATLPTLPTERDHRPKPKPVPVTTEQGHQLFAEMRRKISLL